jgi:homocitrate synthase NifV
MLHKCNILDTTLREGEQTPGVQFALADKCRIIDGLVAVGVDEVELGIGSRLVTCLPELVTHCRTTWPQLRTSIWSRCRLEDICYTAELQPDVISLSIPVSDLHLYDRLEKNREWAFETMSASIFQAKAHGMAVAVGFEDSSRADSGFLLKMAMHAAAAGAFRLRIADTVGICSPGSISRLLRPLLEALPSIEFGVHTHNDFGMATANAIAALENGALWVDTTILGLGERCGCARLEEITAFLHVVGNHNYLKIEQLRELSSLVSTYSGLTIPQNHPVLGANIFTCETGLHLQGLLNNPSVYEPYAPERVCSKRELIFGSKTGAKAVYIYLKNQGYPVTEQTIADNITTFRNHVQNIHRELSGAEIATFFTLPSSMSRIESNQRPNVSELS